MAPLVALSGFMGSGKSSVGRLAAGRLGWRFVDLDVEVELREGRTIPQIFAGAGEAGFRRVEREVLQAVLSELDPREGVVLALGGGTVTVPEATRCLRMLGRIIYLDVPTAEAWSRVQGSDRPLALTFEAFAELAEARRTVYRETADVTLDTAGLGPAEVAERVVRAASSGEHDEGRRAGPGRLWVVRLAGTCRASIIHGGEGALGVAGGVARDGGGARAFVVSDTNVWEVWGAPVTELLAPMDPGCGPYIVEPGEDSKAVAVADRCWQWMAESGARRDDVVVALGGGVVGDLAGFVAATYQRGVSLWQVPTTLLAQVDSSVGGKVAVNLPQGKNLVGAFYQPDLVFVDPRVLVTLPSREFAAGLGEVVKYALLEGEGFLDHLEREAGTILGRDPLALGEIVQRCVMFKAAVVGEDETDRGRRAILNLGHTAAHALETVLGYGVLAHGQAVALGLLVALAVSETVTGLDPELRPRVRRLLQRLGLPVQAPPATVDDLVQAAARDKKITAAGRGFVCLEDIGHPAWGVPVPGEVLGRALEALWE